MRARARIKYVAWLGPGVGTPKVRVWHAWQWRGLGCKCPSYCTRGLRGGTSRAAEHAAVQWRGSSFDPEEGLTRPDSVSCNSPYPPKGHCIMEGAMHGGEYNAQGLASATHAACIAPEGLHMHCYYSHRLAGCSLRYNMAATMDVPSTQHCSLISL